MATSIVAAGGLVVACGIDLVGTADASDASPDAPTDGAVSSDAHATFEVGVDEPCALGDGGVGIACADGCVDPSRDQANCGGCAVACNAASACEGACVEVAASLVAFRIEQRCTNGDSPYCETNGAPSSKIALLKGTQGKAYDLTLRFRGIVEQKKYDGASAAAATGTRANFFGSGGTPAQDNWNVYSLLVPEPAVTLRLNRGTSGNDYVDRIDYTATIRAAARATLTLAVAPIDNREAKNRDNGGQTLVVPVIPPAPNAFDGQFVQIDVTGVREAP